MAKSCLLYYITDRSQFAGDEAARRRALLEKIAEATRAGIDYIQLREKDLSARDLERLARECAGIIGAFRNEKSESGTRLLINSRTDVALAAGADGVHLRSDDVRPSDVRAIWSAVEPRGSQANLQRRPRIAVSCHTFADVVRAQSDGADFAVFAPVFEKRDRPVMPGAGLSALREACAVRLPVLALGGVTVENATSCLDAGAAGIAGIRLFQENRIEDVVRALQEL